jgi:glycosyltransferase involved in cell wall biosynthesis
MNWMPNAEGIRWFIDECLDAVVAKVPGFMFHLAGRNMPEWLKNNENKHLNVVGEVADAKEFVANHNVAIVPLLSGSGIRIKIIESMALGKTVITTMVGAEGILYDEAVNIIIAENKAQMAEAIRRIDENPSLAEEIGKPPENWSKRFTTTARSPKGSCCFTIKSSPPQKTLSFDYEDLCTSAAHPLSA